jgi:hypothetical protein
MAQSRLSRRQLANLALALTATCLIPKQAEAATQRTRLFVIERSKNKNIVCYDLVRPPDQATRALLDVYWRMNQNRGERSELTLFERDLAYGYRVVSEKPLKFALKPAPERAIEVVTEGGQHRAQTAISGAMATLESVYVKTREGGIAPQVLYVELRGHLPNGSAVTERIKR